LIFKEIIRPEISGCISVDSPATRVPGIFIDSFNTSVLTMYPSTFAGGLGPAACCAAACFFLSLLQAGKIKTIRAIGTHNGV
jgi:hypothetical protein